jgi:hypothetical protein
MKSVLIFLLFIGIFMMVTAVYEEKLADAKKQVKIEYKFVPRTFYEEQLGESSNLMEKVGDIFSKESPWFYQTVGGLEDNPLERKIVDKPL